MNKGGSGLYLDANDRDAFEHFVMNSTISFLTTGSFGITYKLTLNPGVKSKYLSLDASTYSQPVNQLILKTTFIYPLQLDIEITRPDNGIKENKRTANMENFYEEVNIQTDVYLKTMQYLEPICPAIVYAEAFDLNDPFIDFITRTYPTKLMRQLVYYPGIKIGIIGMEIVSNADVLYNYMSEKSFYESYVPKAWFALIDFIIKTGYTHGDFHPGNLLVNEVIRNYFWGKSAKISIIDFGFSEKLSQEMYQKIKDLYNQKKYVDILTLLCEIPRKDGYDLNDFEGYTVMCMKSNPNLRDAPSYVVNKKHMNAHIDFLFEKREEAINNLVNTFTARKLPLSNAAKHKMYNGVDLKKEIITTIQPIDSSNPFTQTATKKQLMNTIMDIINHIQSVYNISFSTAKITRILVKTFYVMHYAIHHMNSKLNITSINLDSLLLTAMIYTDFFKMLDNDVNDIAVLQCSIRTQSNCMSPSTLDLTQIKDAVSNGLFLEYYTFYCFIDYLTDEEVNKLALSDIFDLFESNKITNVSATALADEFKITLKKSLPKSMDIENRFQELPFSKTETPPIPMIPMELSTDKNVLPSKTMTESLNMKKSAKTRKRKTRRQRQRQRQRQQHKTTKKI